MILLIFIYIIASHYALWILRCSFWTLCFFVPSVHSLCRSFYFFVHTRFWSICRLLHTKCTPIAYTESTIIHFIFLIFFSFRFVVLCYECIQTVRCLRCSSFSSNHWIVCFNCARFFIPFGYGGCWYWHHITNEWSM